MTKDNKDLNELFSEVSSNTDEKKIEEKIKNKKSNKVVISSVIGVLCLLLGVGGYYIYNNNSFDNVKLTKNNSKNPQRKGEKTEKVSKEEQNQYENLKYPVKVDDWAKVPYAEQKKSDPKKLRENAIEAIENTPFTNYSGGLASEKLGITSDIKDAYIDGVPNPKYSYQTQENLEYNYNIYLNRLLNPIFGGWEVITPGVQGEIERTNFFDDQMKDMFTDDWWTNNVVNAGNKRAIPLYLDWNEDKYGGLEWEIDQDNRGYFFGEVKDEQISVDTLPMENGGGVALTAVLDVDFVANTANKGKVVRSGVLKLKLIPNPNPEGENRNVLSEATLTMK